MHPAALDFWASPSPEPPRPDGARTRALGEPTWAAARRINRRGNNHLVVVVVTQTLGKVQVGGVSGKRAARRSRVKSYIHAGALVQVHLERRPGGLIDPPSGAFPGAGARANSRGTEAAGHRTFPRRGDGRGTGGGGGREGKEAVKKVQVNKEESRGGVEGWAAEPRWVPVRLGGRRGGKEGGLLSFKSSVPSHGLCLRIQEQLLYTKEPRARRGRTDGPTDCRRSPQPTRAADKAGGGGRRCLPARRGSRAPLCHRLPAAAGEGWGSCPGVGATGLRRPGRAERRGAKCRKSRRRAGTAPREERPRPAPLPAPPAARPLPPPAAGAGSRRCSPCRAGSHSGRVGGSGPFPWPSSFWEGLGE